MKIRLAITLMAGSALLAQSSGVAWREFSIGPASQWQSGFNAFGVRAKGVPLIRAVAHAYGVQENRVLGPGWMANERFAITAIVADPKDFQPFFQQELAFRFHLQAHRETRDMQVFVLQPPNGPPQPTQPGDAKGSGGGSFSNGSIKMNQATTAEFAEQLGNLVGRPVLDESKMDGRFDFVLKWQPGSNTALQQSVKDQLGLQLADEHRAIDLVVIDHIEKLEFPK